MEKCTSTGIAANSFASGMALSAVPTQSRAPHAAPGCYLRVAEVEYNANTRNQTEKLAQPHNGMSSDAAS